MPKKKKIAAADHDEELEQWIVEARADSVSRWAPPLEKSLGVRPSDEDIWRIAGQAKDYVDIHREALKARPWRQACKRVDKAAEKFKKALADSAMYYGNLNNAWQKEPAADKALVRVQRLASELSRPREKKKPLNSPLRSLIAAVLDASHNAGKRAWGSRRFPIMASSRDTSWTE